jgi:hypothetical protein
MFSTFELVLTLKNFKATRTLFQMFLIIPFSLNSLPHVLMDTSDSSMIKNKCNSRQSSYLFVNLNLPDQRNGHLRNKRGRVSFLKTENLENSVLFLFSLQRNLSKPQMKTFKRGPTIARVATPYSGR